MRNALVVSEIAFACVLLVGAGLLIRSLIHVLDVDMGFEPARAATIQRRSGQSVRDARAAERLFRRGAAAGESDSRRRSSGHYRRASARPEPDVGRSREGSHLRARPGPWRS